MSWDEGRNTLRLLEDNWAQGLYLCAGFDTRLKSIPPEFQTGDVYSTMLRYNQMAIKAAAMTGVVNAMKLNFATYFREGPIGMQVYQDSIKYIHQIAPEIVVIGDIKAGDVHDTNREIAAGIFDTWQCDAVTVQPLAGKVDLAPFLGRKDKVTIVLCHMSGKGAPEFQDMLVNGTPLYQIIGNHVGEWNDSLQNCMVVAGATYPAQVGIIRKVVGPHVGILLPGIGSQDGALPESIRGAQNRFLINVSRKLSMPTPLPGEDMPTAIARTTTEYHKDIAAGLASA